MKQSIITLTRCETQFNNLSLPFTNLISAHTHFQQLLQRVQWQDIRLIGGKKGDFFRSSSLKLCHFAGNAKPTRFHECYEWMTSLTSITMTSSCPEHSLASMSKLCRGSCPLLRTFITYRNGECSFVRTRAKVFQMLSTEKKT